eukprot:1855660-Rhodomonas_salina.1
MPQACCGMPLADHSVHIVCTMHIADLWARPTPSPGTASGSSASDGDAKQASDDGVAALCLPCRRGKGLDLHSIVATLALQPLVIGLCALSLRSNSAPLSAISQARVCVAP